MNYRKFAPEFLFTGHKMAAPGSVLIVDLSGKVEAIVHRENAGEGLEEIKGLLMPGMVNSHCHLELSHLRHKITEHSGLVDFVHHVITHRHFPQHEIEEAMEMADLEMYDSGIIAVGDICNNTLSVSRKRKSSIRYHNFVEVSGWLPELARQRFDRSLEILHSFQDHFPASLSPHAPYSVSEPLWDLLVPYFNGAIATIHNQETAGENALFETGEGELLRMFELMKLEHRFFVPPGKSSLQSILPKMRDAKNLLLVHNTFTSEADIEWMLNCSMNASIFLCLCVNANLYIENRLPPLPLFRKHGLKLVLGTDSLASNHSLSILDEMKTIIENFPEIPQEEILKWATLHGAMALGIELETGSFEKNKWPGIVWLNHLDKGRIHQATTVKRIL